MTAVNIRHHRAQASGEELRERQEEMQRWHSVMVCCEDRVQGLKRGGNPKP